MKKLLPCALAGILCWSGFFSLSAQDFYDTQTIQEIRIYFWQSNWDFLLDSLAAVDDDARLLAPMVVINGVTFDSVGVKYKGNSSYSPNRPKNPFSIKLDYAIDDQDYQGNTLLKLSNGFKDPSFVREVLGYEIANQYMDAPRANYAKVYVNDVYHGLYSNVESVKSKFLSEHYYSSDGALFKCDPTQGATPPPGCPNMGGGPSFNYINTTDTVCYMRFYELESDYGWTDLVDAISVFNNTPANAAQVIDVDRTLWMLAFNIVLVNLDSYSGSGHNYYVYKDLNERFCPIVWDLNETFGSFTNAGAGGQLSIAQMQQLDPYLHTTDLSRPLINKLLANPLYKKSYMAHLRTILQEYFTNNTYLTRGQTLQTLIDNAVNTDPNKFYTYAQFHDNLMNNIPGGMTIPGITTLMETRKTFLSAHPDLQAAPPVIANVNAAGAITVGESVNITAQVSNSANVKLRYRFNRPGIFVETTMFDDGAHADGSANDGIFGASLSPSQAGFTDYYIFAENPAAAAFSPQRAEHVFYSITVTSGGEIPPGAVVINEFLASNDQGITDPNGELEDWIELYNTTNGPINLEGVFISDDLTNPFKWAFPQVTIAPGGYLLLWADEDEEQEGYHTNFKLSKSGEEIVLINANGVAIDQLIYSNQETDISTGRCPNGAGPFGTMTPTPNAENLGCITGSEHPSSPSLSLRAFPNPLGAQTDATVACFSPQSQQVNLRLLNSLGNVIFNTTLTLQPGDQRLSIPMSDLPSGMYWVQMSGASGSISQPLVVIQN